MLGAWSGSIFMMQHGFIRQVGLFAHREKFFEWTATATGNIYKHSVRLDQVSWSMIKLHGTKSF